MGATLSLDDVNFNVTERAHELLDKYSQTHPSIGKNYETAPFRTMKDVFVMAVYLGSKLGKHRSLDGKRISPFKGGLFNHDEQVFLRSVAIGFTGEPEVIMDISRTVKIIEEFANAGIWELDKIVTSSSEGALWDLADFFTRELG